MLTRGLKSLSGSTAADYKYTTPLATAIGRRASKLKPELPPELPSFGHSTNEMSRSGPFPHDSQHCASSLDRSYGMTPGWVQSAGLTQNLLPTRGQYQHRRSLHQLQGRSRCRGDRVNRGKCSTALSLCSDLGSGGVVDLQRQVSFAGGVLRPPRSERGPQIESVSSPGLDYRDAPVAGTRCKRGLGPSQQHSLNFVFSL